LAGPLLSLAGDVELVELVDRLRLLLGPLLFSQPLLVQAAVQEALLLFDAQLPGPISKEVSFL
jgi:hypothetical protein